MSDRPKSSVAQIVQAFSALCLLGVAAFGYWYSVIPVATKARLEERNAELESSIQAMERQIKTASRETYTYVVHQYIRRVVASGSYEVRLFKFGAYYGAIDPALGWAAKPIAGPWDELVSKDEDAQSQLEQRKTRSLTGNDLLEEALSLPEMRLLSAEDARKFQLVVSDFSRKPENKEKLLQKVMRQTMSKPDARAEDFETDEYKTAAAGETNRLNRVHKDLANLVSRLREILLQSA